MSFGSVLRLAIRPLLVDEAGATAIEYGLIAAAIAVAIAGVVQLVGTNLSGVFSTISASL